MDFRNIENGTYVSMWNQPTIKYNFQNGGGIRSDARTIGAGDHVTVIGRKTQIDTPVVDCLEVLNSISASFFAENFVRLTEEG